MKKNIVLIALSTATLTACYTLPQNIMSGGSASFGMPNQMGGSSGSSSSSGTSGSNNSSSIGIPMNNPNAKKFADAVVKLNIGDSKEDALQLLGAPGIKSPMGDGEAWQYPLNTGAMPAIGYLYIRGNSVVGIEVIATTFSGGTISTETKFTKGTKLKY
jgi:hypothetical protein